VLAVYFGRTAAEISQLDGIALGTAKWRIRQAMLKLREEVEEPRVD
jgi:DNA-directed RNA polymerase specialized sigma24 family protein